MAGQLAVTQGVVNFDYDEGSSNFTNPDNYGGVCVDYLFTNHYEQDLSTYMASQTTETPYNGSTVGFVKIGGPTLLWVCEWTACQTGALPQAPDPVPESTGWVLLDVQPSLAGKSLMTDGVTPIYRISGVYVYGHKNPSANVYDNAVYPVYPWVSNKGTRQMTTGDLKKGLIDGVTTAASNDGRTIGNGVVQVQQG